MADITKRSAPSTMKKGKTVAKRTGTQPASSLTKGVATTKGGGRRQPGMGRSDNHGYPYTT